MAINGIEFLILALATWRLTSLFVDEDGPFLMFARLRQLFGMTIDEMGNEQPTNELSKLLSCVWCFSVWAGLVGVFFLLLPTIALLVLLPFALSASAIIIDGKLA